MSGPKRPILGLLFKALSAAGICVLALGGCYAVWFGKLDWRERQLRRAAHFEECATNLALYWQSYEPFFQLYPFEDPWPGARVLPSCLAFQPDYYGFIRRWASGDFIRLEIHYGGGMERYGYNLERLDASTNGISNWRLDYFVETHPRTLKEFALPVTARFPASAFLPESGAMALADRGVDSLQSSMQSARFLLMTGHAEASNYLADVVRRFPNTPTPRIAYAALLAAFGHREDAVQVLTKWIQEPGATNEIYLVEQFRRSLGATNIDQVSITPRKDAEPHNVDFPKLVESIREAKDLRAR